MKLEKFFSESTKSFYPKQTEYIFQKKQWHSPSEIPEAIPIISIEHDSEAEILREINGVENIGSCFYIEDYGISEGEKEEVFNESLRIFSSKDRHLYTHPCKELHLRGFKEIKYEGYEGVDDEKMEEKLHGAVLEGLNNEHIRYEWSRNDNIYPDMRFEKVYSSMYEKYDKLNNHLMNIIGKIIGGNIFQRQSNFLDTDNFMAANYYSARKSLAEYLIPPHTDFDMITILEQIPTENGFVALEGLIDNKFEKLPAVRGHAIITFGEIINSFTKSEFLPLVHRVVKPQSISHEGWERITLVFGSLPNPNIELEIPPESSWIDYYNPKGEKTTVGDVLLNETKFIEET